MEKGQVISKDLQQKSDRYGDKNFIDFAKEGEWGKVMGDVMLEGARSLPYTIEAMISVPASLTTTGISSAMDKYDELSQRTDLNELQKVTKSILSGAIQAGTELLGSVPTAKWIKSLYQSAGKEVAETAVKRGFQTFIQEQFKKRGLLLAPIAEGLEEVAGAAGEAITDVALGIDPDAMSKLPQTAFQGFV